MQQRVQSENSIARFNCRLVIGDDKPFLILRKQYCKEVQLQLQSIIFLEAFIMFNDMETELRPRDRFVMAIQMAAHCIPSKSKRSPHWFAKDINLIMPAIKARNDAMAKYMANGKSRITRLRLQECRRAVKRLVCTAKSKWIEEQRDSINNGNGQAAWTAIK